jgi:ribosomal protein S18 acetylase RimI-like enzyme
MNIRLAEQRDAEGIARFNQAMARETEEKHLDWVVISSGVEALIAQPEFGFYLVAETEEGAPAGCLLITYEWTDWRNGVFWWIQSVYVDPAHRGQGVYPALYAEVKRRAAADPRVRGFRLYVEENNLRAQASYRKLGMERTVYQMFEELL